MIVLFTVWGYAVTAIECAALLTGLASVGLGIVGSRWTWPPGFLSSLLYCWLFVELHLFASAALQVVFMATSIWGWISWGKEGALVPRRLTLAGRLCVSAGVVVLSVLAAPALRSIGGSAVWGDAFVLVGSLTAQVLMVLQKIETWPWWSVVSIAGALLYASQGLYFTSLFYAVLSLLAVTGWRAWSARSADHSMTPPAAAIS